MDTINATNATILIVDDELANREMLEQLLQPDGYFTEVVASGRQAWRLSPIMRPT